LIQRLKTLGIRGACAGVVFIVPFILWKNGALDKIAPFITAKTYEVTSSAGFKVNEILVTGRRHVAQDEIFAQLNIARGMPVFAIDLEATRQRLLSIPKIKDAALSRRLPDKILINISEREPAALWQNNKKVSVIDSGGTVIDSGDLDPYKDLPMVVGDDAGKTAAALFALLNAEPTIATRISSAVRVGGRRWDLHLKNGMIVMLPAQNTGLALAKLARAQTRDKILGRNIVRIDLRLENKFVIEPGAETTSRDKT
jgi:cell division protein FtsQ